MTLSELENNIMDCNNCSRLRKVTPIPLPHVLYTDNPKLLIIGRNPGLENDYSHIKKEHLMDNYKEKYKMCRVGKYLEKHLSSIIWSVCAVTNICKCSSPHNSYLNDDEIKNCHNYLKSQLKLIQPEIILTLGVDAARWFSQKHVDMINSSGYYKHQNMYYFNIYHPSYVRYRGKRDASCLNADKLAYLKSMLNHERQLSIW